MTNFEKLKEKIASMSVREFEERFQEYVCHSIPENLCDDYEFTHDDCKHCRQAWLKSEVEDDS